MEPHSLIFGSGSAPHTKRSPFLDELVTVYGDRLSELEPQAVLDYIAARESAQFEDRRERNALRLKWAGLVVSVGFALTPAVLAMAGMSAVYYHVLGGVGFGTSLFAIFGAEAYEAGVRFGRVISRIFDPRSDGE